MTFNIDTIVSLCPQQSGTTRNVGPGPTSPNNEPPAYLNVNDALTLDRKNEAQCWHSTNETKIKSSTDRLHMRHSGSWQQMPRRSQKWGHATAPSSRPQRDRARGNLELLREAPIGAPASRCT
eukprot:323911-Pyramimonas_sp.AAC.1